MASIPVITPTSPPQSPGNQTFELLQKRLTSAEKDTKLLLQQLKQVGQESDPNSKIPPNFESSKPLKARFGDNETIQRNCELLVSRVCKMESVIQTLKLNMLRAQAERDLSKKDHVSSNEKLSHASAVFEEEIRKIKSDLSQAKKESKEAVEAKNIAEEKVKQLQLTLDEATSTKTEVTVEFEDAKAVSQKLHRRLATMREELSRESSLRSSLEESHNSLLNRIKEMEDIVQSEREEVKNLNTTCTTLKRETMKAREEAHSEQQLRHKLETQLQLINQDTGKKYARVKALESEKQLLMAELSKMRRQYDNLNQQLDEIKKMLETEQRSNAQLQKDNSYLQEAMKSSAEQNAQLFAKYENEVESGKAELASKLHDSESLKHVKEQLKQETAAKVKALHKCGELERETSELREKQEDQQLEAQATTATLQRQITTLQDQIKVLQQDKERAINEKQNVLDEISQAVGGLTEERERVECQVHDAKLEIQSLQRSKQHLEQENSRLMNRLAGLEDQQMAQKQVEQTMSEMLEQKKKLAYDKGKLQTKVEQLQNEMQSLAGAHAELSQLKRSNTALGSKYNKTETELNTCRTSLQRLEGQVKQMLSGNERKEKDFQLAIQSRDEAVKEAQKLLGHIDALEEREKQKVHSLDANLLQARQDGKSMASTLEGLMTSHSQLQNTIEELQIDLGQKDTRLAYLNNEKVQLHGTIRQLEKEIDLLQSKLSSLDSIETNKVEPLRKALLMCKEDNSKIATSMDTLFASNNELQSNVEWLQDKLQKKEHLLEQNKAARKEDADRHKLDLRNYEERLTNMKQQLAKERDKVLKRTNKDIAEVRTELEHLIGKNGELSRTNTDLRHKVTEQDLQFKDLKEKVRAQKAHIEHLVTIRKKQDDTIDSMQGIQQELVSLEKTKKEYVRKNKEQSRTIENFMGQITALQEEIRLLARTQADTSNIIQTQEEDLSRERDALTDLRTKYKNAKRQEKIMEEYRRKAEKELLVANDESLHISNDLQDAHNWFKSKFENLQEELDVTRKSKATLEAENREAMILLEEERKKAEETANRAKAMIRESRQTISRLADYAELAQKETNTQFLEMKHQLNSERQQSKQAQQKLREFQESSLRHTEDLARELSLLKAQSFDYNSS